MGWFTPPRTPEPERVAPPKQEPYADVSEDGEPLRPRDVCEALCKEKLAAGVDLSNGPCLSNQIADNWVCDVAHKPRQEVDNDPANQCPKFGKTAMHFVEVDPECNFIKEV